MNIDSDIMKQLKAIPYGEFKRILYCKMELAKNKKINLAIDISLSNKKILKTMPEDKMRLICKLADIYLDNAIETTLRTEKKIILIEIYEYDSIFNIVISNAFNKGEDISRRKEKGSDNENDWLEEKQEIIDDYYIQKLVIR